MKKLFCSSLMIGLLFVVGDALAHHPLAGMPMETFGDGLLSGIGHPIIGFDHLFFVAVVGIAAVYTTYRYSLPAVYLASMLLGCFLMSAGIGLPFKEEVVGFSLLALGVVVLSGRALDFAPAMVLFAAFGLFHGSAFGNVFAEQEATFGSQVLIGYLIGLAIIQYAISLTFGWLMMSVFQAKNAEAVEARLAGAVVGGAGLFLTMENIETHLLNLII